MRAIVQRVHSANLSVDDNMVSEIGAGLAIYLGVHETDTHEKAELLAKKIANMRIFADSEGKINFNVKQAGNNILVVSNFTIYADTSRGHRPNFMHAMKPPLSEELYLHFVSVLKTEGINVKTGVFGAHMKISQVCNGPVNVVVEN
jgi:D-tyrosyl-tRNA(Tyr) deacylase